MTDRRELWVACAKSGSLSHISQMVGYMSIDSAINHEADRLGYQKAPRRKTRVFMSSRYFLACHAFLSGLVDEISTDAYPQVPQITRQEVVSIVQGICISPSITHKEIAERLANKDVSLEVVCSRISKTAKAMCQQLQIEALEQSKGHVPGNYWVPLVGFLTKSRPLAQPDASYGQSVYQYLSTKGELAVNRETFTKLVRKLGTQQSIGRWQQLCRSPFAEERSVEGSPIAQTAAS